MTIYVNTRRRAWRKVAMRVSIVAEKRYNYANFPDLVFHIAKIGRIWELNPCYTLRVFIFWLDKNDRPAVGDLRFGNDLVNVCSITQTLSVPLSAYRKRFTSLVRCLQVSGVCGP